MQEPVISRRTILIVGSSTEIIASLRRVLRRVPWQVLASTSFQQSHVLLRQQPVDLVIAGRRDAAHLDGLLFLQQVRERWPASLRLLLTGEVHDREVTRGLAQGLFHDVLPIPWNSQQLLAQLLQAFQSRQAVAREHKDLQQLLDRIGTLPALPALYAQLRQQLQPEAEVSLRRIAALILQDPALTSQLLRVANAAFFGQRQRVDSVHRALVVLGLELVAQLVLFVSLFQTLRPALPAFRSEAFWRHCFGVGLAASHVQVRRAADRRGLERAMVAGLLHDLGKLVLAHFLPEPYAQVLAVARQQQAALVDVEVDRLGASHAQVGGHLAAQWNLPPHLVAAIRWHHQPAASDRFRPLVEPLLLADQLVRQLDLGFSGSCEPVDLQQTLQRHRIQVRQDDLDRARNELLAYQNTGKFLMAWR